MDQQPFRVFKPWLIISLAGWLVFLGAIFPFKMARADEPGFPPPAEENATGPASEGCQSQTGSSDEACVPVNGRSTNAERPTFVPKYDSTGYIKSLYITYHGLGSETHRTHVMNLLENTELNAIVMDIKGDRGFVPYATSVPLVAEIGATRKPMIKDWDAWMQWLEDHNIYTIARLVIFKDAPLASARPEWAVINAETGEIWRDREGLGWTDPTREEVWDYNIALAVEAAQKGFDEIQFDYVRFPSDGQVKRATFSKENTEEIRVETISNFIATASEALAPYDVKFGVDVFGQTAWHERNDMGIGQKIEAIAPYLDVLSPMLYPSTFADGIPRHPEYRNSIAFPYEVLYLSTLRAVDRVRAVNPNLEVRPWIQDFPDYAFDRRIYTPDEVRLQMEGARRYGGRGWM